MISVSFYSLNDFHISLYKKRQAVTVINCDKHINVRTLIYVNTNICNFRYSVIKLTTKT